MNKLFYVVRLKELGLSCLKAELSVKNKARKSGGLVYDLIYINNTKWLRRISKAILSLISPKQRHPVKRCGNPD